jgi:hypothetical protein
MLKTETLNWSQPDSLIRILPALNPIQSGLLLNAKNQIEGGFRWKDLTYGSYEKNASFIAMSDWKKASRYIRCGMHSTYGRVYCKEREYCDFCAWKKGTDTYTALKPAYGRATHWYHITYAYTSNVDLNTVSKTDYLSKFNEGFSYIKKLVSEDVILGAYAVAEYSINSISHSLVFPHIHAVVCSDHPLIQYEGEDMVRTLHSSLDEFKGQGVSLHITEIETSKQFERVVKYSAKAIDLKKSYEAEVGLYPMESINRGLNTILTKTSELEHRFQKFKYFGILDSRKSSYIGYKDPNKVDKRKSPTSKKKKLKVVGVSNTMVDMDVKSTTQVNLRIAKAAAAPVTVGIPSATPKPQKPSLLRRIMPYAAGASALAGGAYLTNKHISPQTWSRGVNWMADKLTPEKFKQLQRETILDHENRARVGPYMKQFPTDMAPHSLTKTVGDVVAPPVGHAAAATEGLGLAVMMKNYLKGKLSTLKNVPPLIQKAPLINPKLVKPLTVAGGLADAGKGYEIAQSPLVNEAFVDPARAWYNPINSPLNPVGTLMWNKINNKDPDTINKLLSTAGLGLGTSAAIKHPLGFLSYPAATAAKGFVDLWEGDQRVMASNQAANAVGADLLMQLYRAAKSGNVLASQGIRRWLEAHESKPITQEPAVAALIARAKNL